MSRLRRIIAYALRQWRLLLVIVALSCAWAGVAALLPWPMKLLVDCALGGETPPAVVRKVTTSPAGLVMLAAAASLLMFALSSALDAGLTWGWTAAGQKMVYDLAGDLFARLSRLSLLFHGKTSVGDSLSRLSGDTWCVYTVTEAVLVTPVQQIVTLATIGVVAFRLDAKLAAVTLAVAPLLGASAYFFGRRLRRQMKTHREAQARWTSFVHTTLGAIPLVQAFAAEERSAQKYKRLADEAIGANNKGLVIKQVYASMNLAAITLGTGVVLYFGGLRVMDGAMKLGTLLVFLAYLRTVQASSQALLSVWGSLKSVEPSIERVLEVLDEKGADDGGGPMNPARAGGTAIEWSEVTFGYSAGAPVLRDVSLRAEPGKMLALVGPTGAGKSTLMSLVPRFFDPWQGKVLIDGQDVRTVRLSDLRARISVVLQEPFLLPLSVAENIAYGRVGASRAEIEKAAVAANADGFIRKLPHGYDTVIGERGASLSGGERQRLAIARAILKDAPILIMDEPTSALDAATEAAVLEALARLMEGRTCIVIAHRLSTVRRADVIAVVQEGRVVETGRHEGLIARGGVYARLCELQFGEKGVGV